MLTPMTDWRPLPLPQLSGADGTGEEAVPVRNRRAWASRWWAHRGWAGVGAVALIATAALVVGLRSSSRPSISRNDVGGIVDTKVGKAITDLEAQPPAGVSVYNQIAPAVVVVETQGAGGASGSGEVGSGVVVNTRGEILTALHVVRGAASIKVSFPDGTDSAATVQSTDPDHDIAVLAPAHLPAVVVPAVLGGGVQVGDDAFAIGHPLGLVDTFTSGVISGLNRSFRGPDGRTLTGLIQFDAAVNPGNSGGPLLNQQGQVIGIVTGLANPAGDDDFVGIGFAVPIGTAGGTAGAPSK
jgi:S1-C subfamily serine protease